jgi:hypothetical protein
MGLPISALHIIAPLVEGSKVLSLGYPDIIATPEHIEEIFGVTPIQFTERGKSHGYEFPLPESYSLFEKVGAELTCIDVVSSFGKETIVDLNHPHDLGKFDLVIDPGTTEHCFNIAQALMNAAHAVRNEGRIFHINPMNAMNHGFFNICPTLMNDFYEQNGWNIEVIKAVPIRPMEFSATRRFFDSTEYNLYTLAQRLGEVEMKYPVQAKYYKRIVLDPMKEKAA